MVVLILSLTYFLELGAKERAIAEKKEALGHN